MGSGSQTIGYHYLMTLLIGFGRGPVDEIRQIEVGDALAWDGHACDNSVQIINRPMLFGGTAKEGGIQGVWRPLMGAADQVLPGASADTEVTGNAPSKNNPYTHGSVPSIKDLVGGLVSEFRGTAMLLYDGLVCSMNPYPKTWKVRLRRAKKGWYNDNCWYPEKAFVFLTETMVFVNVTSKSATYDLNGSTATIDFQLKPADGDTVTINSVEFTFRDESSGLGAYEVEIGSDRNKSAGYLAAAINNHSSEDGVTASASGSTVTITIDPGENVIHAMNGAHIIYEAATNPEWGRGLDASMIDDNSFTYAANTMCNEGLGLCLKWSKADISIDDFIQKVLDHIGGTMYTDRETGLLCLKLFRADYTVADLPVYGPDNGLLTVEDDTTASSDTVYNECIVTGHSPITDQDIEARAQSPAGRISQGAPSTLSNTYEGLPTVALCGRTAQRDLKASISGLKALTLTFDRRAWRIAPGMVFVINYPSRGINGMVVRAGEIDDGTMAAGLIKIKVTQDVFGLPAQAINNPTSSTWNPETFDAVAATNETAYEAGYRDLYLAQQSGEITTFDDTDCYLSVLAASPKSNSYDYQVETDATGDTTPYDDGPTTTFTANLTLGAAIGANDTSIPYSATQGLDQDELGVALRVDDEIMRIESYSNGTMIVARGCADTLPVAHAKGATGWFTDDDTGTDGRAYAVGEVVTVKVLPNTSQDRLDPSNATAMSVTMEGRAAKPYPPANVTVNGISVYATAGTGVNPAPVITWAERNRISQADHLVGYFEATVAAEAGTTYRARVYGEDNATLLATHDGITTPWIYDAATQAADGAVDYVYVELVAVRDNLESVLQRFRVTLAAGYGIGYGLNYGG